MFFKITNSLIIGQILLKSALKPILIDKFNLGNRLTTIPILKNNVYLGGNV